MLTSMFHHIQVSTLAEDEEHPVDQDGYSSPTFRRKSLGFSLPKHRVSAKGRFPLGGIFRAERNFSLTCDFSGGIN